MQLIVDASVALGWVAERQGNELTREAQMSVARHGAVVPFHFHQEVTNGLLMLERRGQIPAEEVATALGFLGELKFFADTDAIEKIATHVLPLARKYGLTVYDATYLELAIRVELPLATRDLALRVAAQQAGAVLFAP